MKNLTLPNYLTKKQKVTITKAIKNKEPIIIKGLMGIPTGKTHLYNILKEQGIVVYEIFDCVEIELNNELDEKYMK